jgi:hypothetical protein
MSEDAEEAAKMIRNRCIRSAYVALNLMIYGLLWLNKPLEFMRML